MNVFTRLLSSINALFGEPCDRCGKALKSFPVFGVPFGTELAWVHKLLTLDTGGNTASLEADVTALVDRVARYAAEPRPVADGVTASIKWCAHCQQGSLLLQLTVGGNRVDAAEYSLFSDGHRRFAQLTGDLYKARALAEAQD
ncbi:MAG: hypothetical protein HY814_08880 [Candidatus Riflebacteria bacterium]|nr:hypothetical protein [Candidatus Riflebacteria bacterium]